MVQFKEAFVKKYSELTDFEAYKQSTKTFVKKSIRVNTLRYTLNEAKNALKSEGWILEPIPWSKDSFYINHKEGRRDIGNTSMHKEGMIFSQGAPSLLPGLLSEVNGRSRVLDLCAAPGGKTHHIACLMKNKGEIIANEPNAFRKRILEFNMKRCGVTNTTFTMMRGEDYISEKPFDVILLDAPCTGSGLIKGKIARTKKLIKEWNPKMTEKYAKKQRRMLEQSLTLLKPKGRIVYSTCSLEPEEDELLINNFLEEYKDMKLLDAQKILGMPVKSSLKKMIKIWPQYYNTFGFFIAVLEKK